MRVIGYIDGMNFYEASKDKRWYLAGWCNWTQTLDAYCPGADISVRYFTTLYSGKAQERIRRQKLHLLAMGEVIARELAGVAPRAGGIVAQVRDHLVVLVQQGHAGAQVGHHDVAVLEEVEVARQGGAADKIEVRAIQREALDARVAAVGDGQNGGGAAAVHDDAVGAIQLARLLAFAAEGTDILAFAVQ